MSTKRCLVACLAASLALLMAGCERRPDLESDYRVVASRIAGPWRLLREDHPPFIGQPPCLGTLRIDMDSPETSTALVTFCGGGSSELSRRVTVEVLGDAGQPDPTARECRMNWDEGATSPRREMYARWSEAVYIESEVRPAFYAEDVLTVLFNGPWLADQPNTFGAMVEYARAPAGAASDYSPR